MPLRNPDPFASRADLLNPLVNPYVAALLDGARGELPVAFGEQLRDAAGTWRARFPQLPASCRLVVEIGCHKGETLFEMAADHPDTAFIGVDITYKRVVLTAQRAKAKNLHNVFCILANAAALHLLFAPGEVDGVVMFFPDPWSNKKRQTKHRLVDAAFMHKLVAILSAQGFFWYKTDCQPYFDSTAELAKQQGLALSDAGCLPLNRDYSSVFERRFASMAVPRNDAVWHKL